MPPLIAPDDFKRLTVGEREIEFFAVVPLHGDEMQLKLDKGLDALFDALDGAKVTEVLHPDRQSAVTKRRGLFRR